MRLSLRCNNRLDVALVDPKLLLFALKFPSALASTSKFLKTRGYFLVDMT